MYLHQFYLKHYGVCHEFVGSNYLYTTLFGEYTYLQIDKILVDAETHCSLVMTSNVLRLTILYHVIH